MKIFKTKTDLQDYLSNAKKDKKSIGFIPTMGALHKGHLSLIEKAQKKVDITVVSIFVNPTQFDNKEDLKNYPKTLTNDIKLLETVNCNVLYAPSAEDVYGGQVISKQFDFDGLEHQMEGKFRKGHFNGVGTIVKLLLEIVKPDIAFFGKKDFQQLQIIKKLVEKHHITTKIIGCSIFREQDGLAMSSRNALLAPNFREAAPFIYKTIKKAKKRFKEQDIEEVITWVENKFKKHPILELEYFTIADQQTLIQPLKKEKGRKYRGFIAVFAGKVRLIDNIQFN